MQRAVGLSILAVTTLTGVGMFVPARPHDYLEGLSQQIKSRDVTYWQEFNPKTKHTRFYEDDFTELRPTSDKQFDDAMRAEGSGAGMDTCAMTILYDAKTFSVSFSPYPNCGAEVEQDLSPRQVLWVRATHLGRDPFRRTTL